MNRRRSVSAKIAMIVTLVWLGSSACHSWQQLESRPPIAAELEEADHIRVRLQDGTEREIRGDIRIVGDSLVGRWDRSLPYNREKTYFTSVPVNQIETIEERRSKPLLTVLAVVGGVYLAAGLFCAISQCFEFELNFSE